MTATRLGLIAVGVVVALLGVRFARSASYDDGYEAGWASAIVYPSYLQSCIRNEVDDWATQSKKPADLIPEYKREAISESCAKTAKAKARS